MGQERLGPSYFSIPLVLGPLNSLVWYVPSLMCTRGLSWRMHCGVEGTESSTNEQHHIIKMPTAPTLAWMVSIFYVDDAVLIARSPEELHRMLDVCQGWAEQNRMSINVNKR